jgi:hypothetical protein
MRKVAPSGKVPVRVVTAATALKEKENSISVRAEIENARFVMRHIRRPPLNAEFLFDIENGSDCIPASTLSDTIEAGTFLLWKLSPRSATARQRQHPVLLKDADQPALDRGMDVIRNNYASSVKRAASRNNSWISVCD